MLWGQWLVTRLKWEYVRFSPPFSSRAYVDGFGLNSEVWTLQNKRCWICVWRLKYSLDLDSGKQSSSTYHRSEIRTKSKRTSGQDRTGYILWPCFTQKFSENKAFMFHIYLMLQHDYLWDIYLCFYTCQLKLMFFFHVCKHRMSSYTRGNFFQYNCYFEFRFIYIFIIGSYRSEPKYHLPVLSSSQCWLMCV
jgi:hypothetical protein